MCPEPQLLSIYMDGELPSPWKEKMESHLAECSGCREKFAEFKRPFEKTALPEYVSSEQEMMEATKDRVWQNLQTVVSQENIRPVRHFQSGAGILRRRVSIPLPAAAAAAIVIAVLAALWMSGGQSRRIDPASHTNMILASEEDLPGIIPVDMNGVLQYLSSEGTDIIILRLPESRNFISSGEPAIINAADYTRRRP